MGGGLPRAETIAGELGQAAKLRFDVSGMEGWDTRLMVFPFELGRQFRERGIALDPAGLPGTPSEVIADFSYRQALHDMTLGGRSAATGLRLKETRDA